jgi:chromosome segregation ATPase
MTEENKKSLMKKTKSELIEIIARKDDTEQKYAGTIKELEKNVAELSDELALKLNVIKSYEEGNSEFGTECEKLKKEVSQLKSENYQALEYQKSLRQNIETLKSRLNTVQEEKEDLQVKCAEWEANYDEIYCESNKYKGISRILTVISVALLGAVMIMVF